MQYIYCFFSSTVRKQERDTKQIPICIISYNQLESLKRLIDFLQQKGYHNIHIIDNNSTYPPLKVFLNNIQDTINVIFNTKNEGHFVFWKNRKIRKIFNKGYYVVTDPDVLPIHDCPDDFLNYFLILLKKNTKKFKVGFSLLLDDIPDCNPQKDLVMKWESRFWKKEMEDGNYVASIDTTFALYRPLIKTVEHFFSAIRTGKPYTALHLGWYVNPFNLTEEQKYYRDTSNKSNTWKMNEKGEILDESYKKLL
ncbi:glycosyltransferase family 2 protein [Zhouia sp. PK063]|uniref:glycosyltransferase family 2 protein n=1 Tax=Zhouia sp. PK063 TaxID=3373602 RepID=UPI00379E1B99